MAFKIAPQSSELTLLFVEDDELCRALGLAQLSGFFKRIVVAKNGKEGLQSFHDYSPDIILTDQNMPGLTGLEMVQIIRVTNQKTPVILITANMDYQMLVEAINLGVTRFVPKPYKTELLIRTLDDVVQKIVTELLLEQHRQDEIELLRYRDQYNSMQQEAALRKERHLVRHDLRHQAITASGGIRWGVEVVHTPRDILCGDGYSVCLLPDERVMVFLIDSMGSGLSASLTTLLATSFFNFHFEHFFQDFEYEFQKILVLFMEYFVGILLVDEVISCGFLLIDLKSQELETALFALPPLLVRDLDGSVQCIRSENPPLSQYSGKAKITRFSLSNVSDLLVVTDGVSDAALGVDSLYREQLQNDFQASPTLAVLQNLFHSRIASTDEKDDRTMLHIRRIDLPASWSWSASLFPSLDSLKKAIVEALDRLSLEIILGTKQRDELELVLSEALTNALEHGCLKIGREEKERVILTGEYDDILENRAAPTDSDISLALSLWRGAKQPLLLLEICDSGPGLPFDSFRIPDTTAVSGRGLQVINRYSDSFFVSSPKGCLLILKTIEGDNNHAD
jgi:CheY-like chemotaxis protein/anti-sigma regulatory factor (Ser/Thr protein kinase)